MHDVRDQGIETLVERTIEAVGEGPVFLTVDVLLTGFALRKR
jgi:hypothetical protein